MRNELLMAPSHRWRVLGIGVAANAAVAAAFAGIPATAVFVRSGYQLSNATFGWAIGAMGLGLALSELPWGLVTDWLGDRKVLLAGLSLTGIVLALMAWFVSPTAGYVPSAVLLGLSLLCVGAIGGSVNGSSGRAVMAWFQDGERGLAMSLRQMSVPAGGALGALMLPVTAEYFGFAAVYGLLAALCFAIAVFTWAWLHEPPIWTDISSASRFRCGKRAWSVRQRTDLANGLRPRRTLRPASRRRHLRCGLPQRCRASRHGGDQRQHRHVPDGCRLHAGVEWTFHGSP